MSLSKHLAKHFRDVHFGGNWTTVNLRDTLKDITWEQATMQVHSFNTLATLLFHVNYFVEVVIKVLEGGPLTGSDTLSFTHPPIHSQEDWQRMQDKAWAEAERFAELVEQLPENKMWDDFANTDKYGNYYRNIQGIIEHTHYHLGQMTLVKKLVQQPVLQ